MITTRIVKWAGHVELLIERRVACMVVMGNMTEGVHLENLAENGRIILKLLF